MKLSFRLLIAFCVSFSSILAYFPSQFSLAAQAPQVEIADLVLTNGRIWAGGDAKQATARRGKAGRHVHPSSVLEVIL